MHVRTTRGTAATFRTARPMKSGLLPTELHSIAKPRGARTLEDTATSRVCVSGSDRNTPTVAAWLRAVGDGRMQAEEVEGVHGCPLSGGRWAWWSPARWCDGR